MTPDEKLRRTRLTAVLLWVLVILAVAFVGVREHARAAPVRIEPAIIEGEAGIAGCPLEALVAVSKVNANHYARFGKTPRWYGWARPSSAAYHIAKYQDRYPDVTGGAVYLFSFEDMRQARVQRLVRNMRLTFVVHCPGGLGLKGYG
jgi:hypothetical protein